jgi:hypothetical protein
MSRTRRPLAAFAIVATVAVISAGCGGTASSSGTTSTTGTASKSSTTSNKNATARDRAVKFSACMRENGYSDFPDPEASGEFPPIGVSVSHAVWDAALGACKALQPPGSRGAKRSPEQQSAALKFAQCMRENGVKDFPDPVNGERLVDMTRIRSQIPSTGMPGGISVLHAAMQKCAVTSWERQWGG